ncbi:MAG TPA: ATP-binding protein [Longimicrobium sp.]|nr:ATP-binding protein [Longimicrobium sp.]
MLIRFRAENIRSIKTEQELSLVASALTEHEETLVHAPQYDLNLLRSAGIYGPNASGKSSVVEAIAFMQAAVVYSHVGWKPTDGVPLTTFALDPVYAEAPSMFAADLLLDGVRYEYGFVADASRIREEWLYAWPRGRRQEWFTRDVDQDDEYVFSRLLSGENRAIRALTRPNSLFLSAAAQNNHEMLSPVHRWFADQLLVAGDRMRGTLAARVGDRCRDAAYRDSVFELLKAADLGISGLQLVDDDAVSLLSKAADAMFNVFGDGNVGNLRLLHRAGAGPDVALAFSDESAGTRTLFTLAGTIVEALASGGTLVVDELDRSLHPHLSTQIVRTFNDPAANPRNAQLIFNTHDTNLLDAGILRRDQVWFTEKGDDGATHLFPLTDFRARKSENLERGYLQGRYGAVPSVGTPVRGTGA